MFDIFKSMIKEEWRMHSSLFGRSAFSLFPVFVFLFTFFVSLVLPVFREIITDAQIALGMHYFFLLVGAMVGTFGVMGREFMNRRFGQASLIAYSSRVLPVSERFIFANFLGKDVVYYFVLYIVPFVAGFSLATKFISVEYFGDFSTLSTLTLTLSLSFAIGISAVFFLSTVYAHSGKLSLLCLFIASVSINRSVVPSMASSFTLPGAPSVTPSVTSPSVPSIVSSSSVFREQPEANNITAIINTVTKKLNFLISITPFIQFQKLLHVRLCAMHDFHVMMQLPNNAAIR